MTTTGPLDEAAASSLRAEFPIFHKISYLNAGSAGPVPYAAVRGAQRAVLDLAGRGGTELELWMEFRNAAEHLRAGYARLLGCGDDEVALTASTTDGVNLVLSGLGLNPGDEILTTDEEHVGLVAPLATVARRAGVNVRMVGFAELPSEIGRRTRLVACSHVSCITGSVIDTAALAQSGVPLLLDGAQALGAIPVDVRKAGCLFYAASGQKWLCGAEGTGCLFVNADAISSVAVTRAGYWSFLDPWSPHKEFRPGARRFDTIGHGVLVTWSLEAMKVLESAGWTWIFDRSRELADRLAQQLSAAGAGIAARGPSTLVSWRSRDPDGLVRSLAAKGLQIRRIPGRDLVRASVGAWSTAEELDRLVDCAATR